MRALSLRKIIAIAVSNVFEVYNTNIGRMEALSIRDRGNLPAAM
jgi:hypothetical protein